MIKSANQTFQFVIYIFRRSLSIILLYCITHTFVPVGMVLLGVYGMLDGMFMFQSKWFQFAYLKACGTVADAWCALNSVLAVAKLMSIRSHGSLSSRYRNT